jgi:toxin-antitoxin system PIN domain toxin
LRIPDANVLLYAFDEESPRHSQAQEWLERKLSSPETVGLAWLVVVAFLRLGTSGAVFTSPMSAREALDEVDGWLARPTVAVVDPTDRHAATLRELLESAGTAGNLTNDAHLAAIAIEHGATVASFDGDFHRFSGLKLEYLGGA